MRSHHHRDSPAKPAGEPDADATSTGPAHGSVPTLRDVEGAHIHYALQASNWNKREAARALGISRDTLYRKIVEHGLDPDRTHATRRRSSLG